METDATDRLVARRSVTVPLPPDRAYVLFTRDMGRWWPLQTHSIAQDTFEGRVDATALVFEEGEGGRIYEVMSDGAEGDWGTVLTWEPPDRVAFTWKPNLTTAPSTRIDVLFTAVENGTRVELVHRGWEAFGADAEARRAGYESGWAGILERLAARARDEAVESC
jgi:uncharacterized protein YndB with AHSA1/START domain